MIPARGSRARGRRLAGTVAAALLFIGLTAVMTWPLVATLPTAIGDHGDPLLNSWILAWNAHWWSDPTSGPWFDANIFHPHPGTLAWSEHLLPQSLLAAPLLWAGGGPVLAHNILLFLAFATNGLAMFLLARRHTADAAAAVVGGIVFAFSPFMFGHLWHLQVLCAAGIPLTFLLLERLFERERAADALLLAGVVTAQVLANGYYAVFMSLLVPVFVAVELTRLGRWSRTRLWVGLGCAAFLVVALSAPLFAQYAGMQRETGLIRHPAATTTWPSLLAVHPLNRVWGPLTSHLGAGERHLFPGLIALVLAAWGALRRDGRHAAVGRGSTVPYLAVVALALLLSFGSGPYRLVRDLWPGFDAVRAVSRLHVFVILGLALLAARGAAALVRGGRSGEGRARRWIPAALALGLLVEYATFPIPWAATFDPSGVPPVYRWIADNTQGDDVLLELPIPLGSPARPYAECDRLYASTFHWRRLVNGYSGIEPPLYVELFRRWDGLDVEPNLRDAADLGVRWIVVHTDLPGGAELAERLDARSEALSPAAAFRDARVYELAPSAPLPSAAGAARTASPLPRDSWRVGASAHAERAGFALDGDPATRWDAGPQTPGTSFEVDRRTATPVCAVSLRHGPSPWDWPRGLRVEGSDDGRTWSLLAERSPLDPPLTTWLTPATATVEVSFPPTRLRWIRLVLTVRHDDHYWSIYELELRGGPACPLEGMPRGVNGSARLERTHAPPVEAP